MGFSLSGGSSSNYGLIFVPLKSVDLRTKKGPGHTANDIFRDLSPKLFGVPGGIVAIFEPPAIQGLGSFGGFAFELQDLGRNTLGDLDRVAHTIIGASRREQRTHQPVHQLYGERPATPDLDRSCEGKGSGRSCQPDQLRIECVHGVGVCERL